MHILTHNDLWLLGGLDQTTGAAAGWLMLWIALAAAMTVSVAALWAILKRRRRLEQSALRYLQSLCQIAPRELYDDQEAALPPLPASGAWRDAVREVRAAFGQQARELRNLEQASAAAEIRRRRSAEESEQIRSILADLPEPILAVDGYGELTLSNRSAEQLFRWGEKTAETRAMTRLVHCQKLLDLLTAASQRRTPGARTEEIEIPAADGESRWYRATAARLAERAEGASAEAEGAVVVLRDIGDQKVLQRRNAEFVSAVSHEMKTPLAGIRAYVELLVDGDAEDEATREEFLGVINSQADRLQRLVDNMLNLARIEAGVVHVNKQSQSLNEVLEEALQVVQPSAEAKNIAMAGELSPLYLGVLADRDMLLQAVINLLSNAVKYTPAGGRVTLRSRMDDQRVRFEVEDNGVGLSEEDCSRVFEKFYRVKKDEKMAQGTGLGLPLAKHIVEDVHSGRLWVESKPGQGSTFIATFPNAGQMS